MGVEIFILDTSAYKNYTEIVPFVSLNIASQAEWYFRDEDKCRYLFGRLLIKKMLLEAGFPEDTVSNIKLGKNNRPYINSDIDFNISHSGCFLVGAVSKSTKVGVDIEEINKKYDESLEAMIMSDRDLLRLYESSDPIRLLYDTWTLKEATLKAVGTGVTGAIKEISILPQVVSYEGEQWYYKKLDISIDYSSHVVFKHEYKVNLRKISPAELLF